MTAIHSRFILPAALVVILCVGCDSAIPPPTPGGYYPPVTPERLAGSTTSQRTGQDDFEFEWSFGETLFVIEGSAIPTDLMSAMLGPDVSATKIEGKWEIRDGTIHFFVDTEISDSVRECSMSIYSTGPIRIESSAAQYVF
jgi:hypothetical protein